MTQTDKLKDDNFMNEKIDLKRYLLCLLESLKYLAGCVIAGAVIGVSIYLCVTNIGKLPEYEIANDYYITFNEKEYSNGMDYYNAYTWNNFVTDDKIVNAALTKTEKGIGKDDIKNSVTSQMMGDYRVLTVVVRGTDKEKVADISEAYKYAMPEFANAVAELSSIELWSENGIKEVKTDSKAVNAGVLGAIIALIIFGFIYAFKYALDDTVRLETDVTMKITDVPFLGYTCGEYKKDYDANFKSIAGDRNVVITENVSDELESVKNADACVIKAVYKRTSIKKIRYELDLLKKQNINCLGIVLEEADEGFLKRYYGK